ncbi:interleukin-6 receptor subunit beta isoform X2 [Stigmatopora nigra]
MSMTRIQLLVLTFLAPVLSSADAPEKPKNVTCKVIQNGIQPSSNLKCSWETSGQKNKHNPTNYSLHAQILLTNKVYSVETQEESAMVEMDSFPFYMELEIYVVAQNELGSVESDHLIRDPICFVKTDPPLNVQVIPENTLPRSLLIRWNHSIDNQYVKLRYEIRYSQKGSNVWSKEADVDEIVDIRSFRLQNLLPDSVYNTQVRCKPFQRCSSYWSRWSANVTEKTPETRPTSKPRLWKIVTEGERNNERQLTIICKNPVSSNGKITSFKLKYQTPNSGNISWESILLTSGSKADDFSGQNFTTLKQIILPDDTPVVVYVKAINSMGESPIASLRIPKKARELDPVEKLKVEPRGGQLFVKWTSPNNTAVSEYVVEWMGPDGVNWQKENKSTYQTTIKDQLEKFVCYNISVYPIYSGWTGKPTKVPVYLEEGAPIAGPSVGLKDKADRNGAEITWNEIPPHERRGFITNYTIFYSNGIERGITVPASVNSYMLDSLTANTKYDTWIQISTRVGSFNGTSHSFTTQKYASGEIEMTVVGVCGGFLFVFLLTVALCIYKRDVIKRNLWPRIPNPRMSTIGNWSPDHHLQPETPKENCVSGISILDMEDGKSVSEEDKDIPALKKDKYLSEEHSSGIGGSSCMSSPRQSVSDSDEGADAAETTASTVQYSSVVASNGYKAQQLVFARSESTQPLLDSEENPDVLVAEPGRNTQALSPCFAQSAWNRDDGGFAESNEVEAEPREDPDGLLGESRGQEMLEDRKPFSSYVPQLGGYRPQ